MDNNTASQEIYTNGTPPPIGYPYVCSSITSNNITMLVSWLVLLALDIVAIPAGHPVARGGVALIWALFSLSTLLTMRCRIVLTEQNITARGATGKTLTLDRADIISWHMEKPFKKKKTLVIMAADRAKSLHLDDEFNIFDSGLGEWLMSLDVPHWETH